jgi:hypothetical protein
MRCAGNNLHSLKDAGFDKAAHSRDDDQRFQAMVITVSR